jgi:hypothetical protein
VTPVGGTPPDLAQAREGGPEWTDGASTPRSSGSEQRKLVLDSRRSVRDVAGELGPHSPVAAGDREPTAVVSARACISASMRGIEAVSSPTRNVHEHGGTSWVRRERSSAAL